MFRVDKSTVDNPAINMTRICSTSPQGLLSDLTEEEYPIEDFRSFPVVLKRLPKKNKTGTRIISSRRKKLCQELTSLYETLQTLYHTRHEKRKKKCQIIVYTIRCLC